MTRPNVEKAIHFAERAHRGQKRKTGEAYITHCIHTALILENLLGASLQNERCEMAVICAILHDVLDDTSTTYTDLRREFGEAIATAVRQISEMSSMIQLLRRHRRRCVRNVQNFFLERGFQEKKGLLNAKDREVEDQKLRTAILKRLKDPLILAVKLADRLHNLRTIYALKPEKQRTVALETQKIFCTLAERLGLFSLKVKPFFFQKRVFGFQAEMEDLCFCVLQPKEFWEVYQKVQLMWKSEKTKQNPSKSKTSTSSDTPSNEVSQKQFKDLLQLVTPFTAVRFTNGFRNGAGFGLHFLQNIAEKLIFEIKMLSFSAGLDIDVIGRVKSLYSIYRKMKKKQTPLEDVYDILALRVIVTEDGDKQLALQVCYKILELVQHLWKQIPSELDDYIVTPKRSGYQSLHASLRGPGGVPFEIQIRTASMDESAEYGHAAHWCYKEDAEEITAASSSLSMRDAIWGPKSSIVGHPVVRIRDGSWRDGIVVRTENEGLGIIVAVNISERMSHSYSSYTFAVRQSYEELLQYVEKKEWVNPGSGDFNATLERYVLCSDHAYHLIDNYGHKHPTVVRPLKVFESDRSLASHLEALGSGTQGNTHTLSKDQIEMKHRVTHLRSMLEYCDDLRLSTESETSTFHVLVFPEGKMHSFKRGATVADVLASRKKNSEDRDVLNDQLVNVNNRLVKSDTLLRDGDYIVLQKGVLKI